MRDNKIICFEIKGEEYRKLKKFEKEHEKCHEKYPDVLCALLEYRFIPTGLGMAVTVQCACGEELDLTDLNF